MDRSDLLVAASALICSGAVAQDALPAQSTFVGLQFPNQVSVFAIQTATRYDDPALGIALTYVSGEIPSELAVYVYPVPDDAGEEALRTEFDNAWLGIQQYAESNRDGVELELGDQRSIEITAEDGATHTGWRGDTIMQTPGGALDSSLLVFLKGKWFIKYRITYERPSRRIIAPHLESFLGVTLAMLLRAGVQ